MTTTLSYDDYRRAASVLWGKAGVFAVDESERINNQYFGGELPPLPIVIGITAYGHCIGLTRSNPKAPRISLASNLFAKGINNVSDVLLHEMVHAKLMLEGRNPKHNGSPWCEEISRLSPIVLGHIIKAAPVSNRRIKSGDKVLIRRVEKDGYLPRQALARWPQSVRPDDFNGGHSLYVDSY